MQKTNKKAILGILALLSVLTLSIVSAEFWACFDYGQRINYCDDLYEPDKPDKTCDSSGGCTMCMSVYREADNCYGHGSWPKCLDLSPGTCSIFYSNDTDGEIDTAPPVISLNYPELNNVYTSRSTLVEFSLDEKADVFYRDLDDTKGWTKICNECSPGNPSYSSKRSFDEGLNNIGFKAVDVVGNEAYLDRSFFIDSEEPKITKTLPKKGFADGNFYVQFKEENPTSLVMHYGNDIIGMKTRDVNVGTECYEERGKHYCDNVYVSLNSRVLRFSLLKKRQNLVIYFLIFQ